jgi:hypothetical protein
MSASILCGKELDRARESAAIYEPGVSLYTQTEVVQRVYVSIKDNYIYIYRCTAPFCKD